MVGAEPAQRRVELAQQRAARGVDDAGSPVRRVMPALVQMTTSSRSGDRRRAGAPSDLLGRAVGVAVRRVDAACPPASQEGRSWSRASSRRWSRPHVIVPRPSRETGARRSRAGAGRMARTLSRRHRARAVGQPRRIASAACELGVNLGYWGAGNDADNLALAQEADRLGYARGLGGGGLRLRRRRPCSPGSAAQTERIGLGAAVMQIPARTPAMTAMTAATLDTLSGGRFRLGLGVSGPAGQRGLARRAVRRARSARTREYVDIVRMALRRETGARTPGGTSRCRCRTARARRCGSPSTRSARRPADLPRRGRAAATSSWPARSPTAGWPSSSAPSTPATCSPPSRRAARGRAGRRATPLAGFDVVPTVPVGRRRRPRGGAREPLRRLRRALHRRHGQPRAELLQRSWPCRMGFEEAAARGPGPLPRRPATGTPRPPCRSSSSTRPR